MDNAVGSHSYLFHQKEKYIGQSLGLINIVHSFIGSTRYFRLVLQKKKSRGLGFSTKCPRKPHSTYGTLKSMYFCIFLHLYFFIKEDFRTCLFLSFINYNTRHSFQKKLYFCTTENIQLTTYYVENLDVNK